MRVVRVKKSNINGENTFNGDHFKIECNHGSNTDKKNCFGGVFSDL